MPSYRTDDLTRWGTGIGRNLTAGEVDLNFWELRQALNDLIASPLLPKEIVSASSEGTAMTLTLSDGSTIGPIPLPVLAFRWRGDWEPGVVYLALDTFRVEGQGLFSTLIDHVSPLTFDVNAVDDGDNLLYNQLFGSVDASLSHLIDVQVTDLADGDVLEWNETDAKWENVHLGTMSTQDADAVAISGGTITGLPTPVAASDAVTKAYADALGLGPPSISSLFVLANLTGGAGSPSGHSLSDVFDAVLGNTRGSIIFRTGTGWVVLSPGTAGQVLRSGGSGADVSWAAAGSGGVTSVGSGAGLAGGPITATGSLSLATIPDGYFLANVSGGVAAPSQSTLSAFLDHVVGTARATLVVRNATGWVALTPGTAGQYLKSQGSTADLAWDSPAGSGTVTEVDSGTGLTGGPITATGSLSLAAIADGDFLANISGGSAAPGATTLTDLIDHVLGSGQGGIIVRTSTAWVRLAPGTSGQFLKTQGTGANAIWDDAPSGSSVADGDILANISGGSTLPTGHTLSDVLDYIVGSNRGDFLMRGASGWTVLPPGTAGQVLTTGGPTTDPSWVAGSAAALAGDSDVSLSSPADHDLLSFVNSASKWENKTLSFILDAVLGSTQGGVAYRGASAWSFLGAGTSGQLLATQGASADPHWVTVTPGSASLAGDSDVTITSVANSDILSYVTSASKWENKTLTALLDALLGSTRGSVMYRGASGWAALTPGRANQSFQSGGTGADPFWYYAAGRSIHTAVSFATTAALPSCTYSNGTSGIGATLTATANGALPNIDGVAIGSLLPSPVGYAVLVKDQATQTQNGVYYISQYGDSTHPWILTRREDSDQAGNDPQGTNFDSADTWFVDGGTVNGQTMWMMHHNGVPPNVKVGTISPTFAQIAGVTTTSGAAWLLIASPTANQVLQYNATDAKFENVSLSAAIDAAITSAQYSLLVRGASTWDAAAAGLRLASLSNNDFLVYNSTDTAFENQRQHYDIACFATGLMANSQKLLMHRFSKAVTIPANFGSYLGRTSQASGSANATASTVINVNKAATATPTTFSNVGTITIASGSVTPTFASTGGTAISFAQGDVLQLVGPASADATLADFCATLCGYET